MHEAADAYSTRSTWLRCWLDQFLTLALSDFVEIFNILLDCLLFILFILVGVELPLCIVVTLSWNAIPAFWSQVEYKVVLF